MIRAHDGRAGCCLDWNIYEMALIVDFKRNACIMNVIAKISCYFERTFIITLKLCKEYLNTVTHNTPVLLRYIYWTI